MKYVIVFVAGAIAGAYVFGIYSKSESAKKLTPEQSNIPPVEGVLQTPKK